MDTEIMINKDIWLHKAQQLHIGQSVRVRHGRENRLNLHIENANDRWWCYCHSCKEGGTIQKEHVLLTALNSHDKPDPVLPTDLILAQPSEYGEVVGRYLSSKGMAYPYLPPLYLSLKSKRILIHEEFKWHGRDITDKSNYKWMNYDNARFVGNPTDNTIITEDLFSYFKMKYALGAFKTISVCCTLGAHVGQAAKIKLSKVKRLVFAYDADKAGDDGYTEGKRAMQVYVPNIYRFRPPEGHDPKDMQNWDIRNLMTEIMQTWIQ